MKNFSTKVKKLYKSFVKLANFNLWFKISLSKYKFY